MAKSKARLDQPEIPGTETPKNQKVHNAAVRYAKRRDERMAANEEEKAAQDTLVRIMHEEGLTSYCYKGLEVHVDTTKKAKVKLAGEGTPPEEKE